MHARRVSVPDAGGINVRSGLPCVAVLLAANRGRASDAAHGSSVAEILDRRRGHPEPLVSERT
jgi:hypothetical protein